MNIPVHNKKVCDTSRPYAFISYSSHDKETVFADVAHLRSLGVNLWIDEEMGVGQEWKKEACDAMECTECKLVIFYISEHSISSQPVLSELEYSRSRYVALFNDGEPLRIHPIQLENLTGFSNLETWLYKKLAPDFAKAGHREYAHTASQIITDYLCGGNLTIQGGYGPHDNAYFETILCSLSELGILSQEAQTAASPTTPPAQISDDAPAVTAAAPAKRGPGRPHKVETSSESERTPTLPASKPAPVYKAPAEPLPEIPLSRYAGTLRPETTLAQFRVLACDVDFCRVLGQLRRNGELFPRQRGLFDYAMLSVLGGCNAMAHPYQQNYYDQAVANPDHKIEGAKRTADWTWSSNARKVVGLEKAGRLDPVFNAPFEVIAETVTLAEMRAAFLSDGSTEYHTKDNAAVARVFDVLLEKLGE